MVSELNIFNAPLSTLDRKKGTVINTINAHSYNVAMKDKNFQDALKNGEILIPDGIGIVMLMRLFKGIKLKKIAGADLFYYEMNRLNSTGGKCFFLGSSDAILAKIRQRAAMEFPNVIVQTFSPPYVKEFSKEENERMIREVNAFEPDVLFVGMTAPKQEKWVYEHFTELKASHIGCIGAVFDFYAGTVKRAPQWMINSGLEWFYRLYKEPKRMWRRYLVGNVLFIWNIVRHEIF
ncbi:WecB/TagA/CpsF family glycosyltransferase [Saccharicrinis sp. FJH62]|uniref:WecB/TagA/CpsF family glycosyltransferase n=1 Tax=Saccharicrinis sp. FJH62 TaxID=3344657 RepID=UPI0035D42405